MTDDELSQLRAKWAEWQDCMGSKDRHGIVRQIWEMVWDAGVFRLVNRARQLAPPAKEGGVQLNGMIHEWINDMFFDSQAAAIRRLTDYGGLSGNRGIYSLNSLLKDMQDNAHLMTRENVLAVRDLEYSYDEIRDREPQHLSEQARAGLIAFALSSDLKPMLSEQLHSLMDSFCGVRPCNRKRTDATRPEVFERLRGMIDPKVSHIRMRATKFVAHAATPTSRQTVSADDVRVTLGSLYNAHKVICQVANLLDARLLSGINRHFLSLPMPGQYIYIDRPLVRQEDIGALEQCWEEYNTEVTSWCEHASTDLPMEL